MSQIAIRVMENKDITAVSKLEQKIFSLPWSENGFAEALLSENTLFAVVEVCEEIVGYCGMYFALDEGEITNVAVNKTSRRKGIGREMLKFLLEKAEDTGIEKIALEVRISNRAAIGLYEKFGFERKGIRRNFYQKPKEDGVIMIRSREAASH